MKTKKVTIRLELEDWQVIRDEAYRLGRPIAPYVQTWVQERIERLKRATAAKAERAA